MNDGIIEEWVEINGCIWGYIYDDQKGRFEDGESIKTSRVTAPGLDKIDSYMTVCTKNSTYFLGAKAGENA